MGRHGCALLWFDFAIETHETGAQLLSSLVPNEKSMPLFQQLFGCCVQVGDSKRVEGLFEIRAPSQKG
jgi:uncharacterized membrane protein YeiB